MKLTFARQEEKCGDRPVVEAAMDVLLSNSHFRRRAECFDFQHLDGELIVEGVVPSFYLKQLLQRLLGDLENVRRVDNRVRVVCNVGLSSAR